MSKRSWPVSMAVAVMATVTCVPSFAQTPRDSAISVAALATPEQQGMDSRLLAEMFDYIEHHGLQIHSVAVLRKHHVVLEAYFHPFRPDYVHHIGSSTKSITSALVGIAIDKEFIRDVHQPLLSFFESRETANTDERKERVTLEHLLTMSSGFEWPTTRFLEHIGPQWDASADLVQFVLDRPMEHEPGTRFNYNSGNAHVLSAVIQQATGMTAARFAEEHLFAPLGMSGVVWPSDENGVSWGGGKIMMTTRDMLKLGYLFLNDGVSASEQVVSSAWIRASSSPRIETFYENDRYGYLWWIHPTGRYRSLGTLGQCIYVIPQKEMVVAVTGGLGLSRMEKAPDELVDSFIIPAVVSDTPLPNDPDGLALLRSKVESVARPTPEPVPPLPETAQRISNSQILLDGELIGHEALRFNFDGNAAEVRFGASGEAMAIGLDGVHRVSEASSLGEPEALVGLKGRWERDTSFALHIVFSHGARFDTLWDFGDAGVSIQVEEPLASYRVRGRFPN